MADPAMRAKYGPYPESGFPQIVQAVDYATIQSIEALYSHLARITREPTNSTQFGITVDFAATNASLTLRSLCNPARSVVIRQPNADITTIQAA